jgi:hypothetical protein
MMAHGSCMPRSRRISTRKTRAPPSSEAGTVSSVSSDSSGCTAANSLALEMNSFITRAAETPASAAMSRTVTAR